MHGYDRQQKMYADMQAETDTIVAGIEAEHAKELEKLKSAARAYRGILYGAEGRGEMSKDMTGELNNVEDRYADLIED